MINDNRKRNEWKTRIQTKTEFEQKGLDDGTESSRHLSTNLFEVLDRSGAMQPYAITLRFDSMEKWTICYS